MKSLSSRQNALFRQWMDLRDSKGIKKHGQFLLSGQKTVPEVLARFPDRIQSVVQPPRAVALDHANSIPIYQLSSELFGELDDFNTRYPLLICDLPKMEKAEGDFAAKGAVVLCAMGDPANVGALVRTSLAFGRRQMILLEEAATPFHPKAVRSSSGAVLEMSFLKGPSLKKLPESWRKQLVVLDSNGDDIGTYQFPRDFFLLIGEEGQGVPNEVKGLKHLRIPIDEAVESLNAVSAASIALYIGSKQSLI